MRSERTLELVEEYAPALALLVALVATLGSLYYSEVRGFIPCTLCWYQRILMYPLVAILLVGLLRRSLALLVGLLELRLRFVELLGQRLPGRQGRVTAVGAGRLGQVLVPDVGDVADRGRGALHAAGQTLLHASRLGRGHPDTGRVTAGAGVRAIGARGDLAHAVPGGLLLAGADAEAAKKKLEEAGAKVELK